MAPAAVGDLARPVRRPAVDDEHAARAGQRAGRRRRHSMASRSSMTGMTAANGPIMAPTRPAVGPTATNRPSSATIERPLSGSQREDRALDGPRRPDWATTLRRSMRTKAVPGWQPWPGQSADRRAGGERRDEALRPRPASAPAGPAPRSLKRLDRRRRVRGRRDPARTAGWTPGRTPRRGAGEHDDHEHDRREPRRPVRSRHPARRRAGAPSPTSHRRRVAPDDRQRPTPTHRRRREQRHHQEQRVLVDQGRLRRVTDRRSAVSGGTIRRSQRGRRSGRPATATHHPARRRTTVPCWREGGRRRAPAVGTGADRIARPSPSQR